MSVFLTIGLQLDGQIATYHKTSAGELTFGPHRLLQWLEGQCGLESPDVSFTSRALQYLSCLKKCDSPQRFYHASLNVDEIGVSRRLLGWRDSWYEAGWKGQELSGASRRLQDMVDVEKHAQTMLPHNIGQRIQAVIVRLKVMDLPVTVKSIDAIEQYASAWQDLLVQLGTEEIQMFSECHASVDTDLGKLQSLLLNDSFSDDPIPLLGDGSVVRVIAPSEGISSAWLSSLLATDLEAGNHDDIGLCYEGSGDELNLAFEHAGVAMLSSTDRSPWRPIFQVLPLVLDLLWNPLNPRSLLEFLTHPVGPLPRRLKRRLAEVVANEPGIGGDNWQYEINCYLDAERERLKQEKGCEKKISRLREDISFWLECDRYSQACAPIDCFIERSHQLNEWVSGLIDNARKANDHNTLDVYYRAQNQIVEFRQAVNSLRDGGKESLDIYTVRRLVKSVRGEGSIRPDHSAQTISNQNKYRYSDRAAGMIEPVKTVFWWACDETPISGRYDWTQQEIAVLRSNRVNILPLDASIDWQAKTWLRPVLMAQDKIILVVHSFSKTHHPVFDHFHTLVDVIPSVDLLTIIQANDQKSFVSISRVEAIDQKKLPAKKRIWQLPDTTRLKKRDVESFSSLESFLYGPYMWVLRYQAKLKTGSMLSVSDNNLLKGSVAHKLFENFFNAHPEIQIIDENTIGHWVLPELEILLSTSGAVLLSAGRTAEKEYFIRDVHASLSELIKHLKSADVVSVIMESHSEGLFVGGKLSGYVDLLAVRSDGAEAVIDIKWGGGKYRRQSIEEGSHLQLAIYAHLRKQETKVYPAVGYFIISSKEMLMAKANFFPNAVIVSPSTKENIAELFCRLEHSWKQRRQQLDGRLIEVNVSGTEVNQSLLFDAAGLLNHESYEPFSEFTALVGWGENS